MAIENIKKYPCELHVSFTEKERESIVINYDGQIGEFNREEWKTQLQDNIEDGGYGVTNIDEQEEILNSLDMCSNSNFFALNIEK